LSVAAGPAELGPVVGLRGGGQDEGEGDGAEHHASWL